MTHLRKAQEYRVLAVQRHVDALTFLDLADEQSRRIDALHNSSPDYSLSYILRRLYTDAARAATEAASRFEEFAKDHEAVVEEVAS